jgi:hypothetical protein
MPHTLIESFACLSIFILIRHFAKQLSKPEKKVRHKNNVRKQSPLMHGYYPQPTWTCEIV